MRHNRKVCRKIYKLNPPWGVTSFLMPMDSHSEHYFLLSAVNDTHNRCTIKVNLLKYSLIASAFILYVSFFAILVLFLLNFFLFVRTYQK